MKVFSSINTIKCPFCFRDMKILDHEEIKNFCSIVRVVGRELSEEARQDGEKLVCGMRMVVKAAYNVNLVQVDGLHFLRHLPAVLYTTRPDQCFSQPVDRSDAASPCADYLEISPSILAAPEDLLFPALANMARLTGARAVEVGSCTKENYYDLRSMLGETIEQERDRKRSEDRGKDREGRDRDEEIENRFRSERDYREGRENKDRESSYRYMRDDRIETREDPGEYEGGKEVLSLTIESNELRAKLGLKPLIISDIVVEEVDLMSGELLSGDNTGSLVPQHWGERDQQEKLGIKIDQRTFKSKLAVFKGRGGSKNQYNAEEKWVERQKKKVKEEDEAEKRAKATDELDQEFGVQEVVENSAEPFDFSTAAQNLQ